ncbi:metallophosphoesterase [Fundicoccus culcitae]|uniref:Phosphoesterase n=1 Tax=Fundicoccus culcitae TaxID=2969821 RepID=A0ABY5P6K8_9LACT|nr:metallophosphoesterase [Fundicoccus culcitae]UUX34367.1 metallophosphoesterase [Fundicoccus culcitae]
MKVLVMSDNHGRWQKVQEIITKNRPYVDYIIHCGDSEFPADDPIWDQVDSVVSGNMDYDPQYRQLDTLGTKEEKFLNVHGHRHNVNHSLNELGQLAQSNHANFVFYGHTHKLAHDYHNGCLFLNPGSLSRSRGINPEKTYAIVTIDSETIQIKYYNDEHQRIDRLTAIYKR